MTLISVLFIVGAILLAFEVIVPGAILGIGGALALIAGVVLAFFEHGSGGGLWALATALGLAGATVLAEFVILPRTRFGKRMFLRAAIEHTSQPALAHAADVVGQEGEALTPLMPSGYVMIGGRRFEAFSRSGAVAAGERVRVVGLDNFRIIVSKPSSSSTS